jgi:hypothetical protein
VPSLLDRGSASANSASASSASALGSRGRPRLPTPSRRRKPLVALVSLTVVCASIAIFADLYASADRQVPVLIVTSTIQQGQLITGSLLGQASASISGGVTPIPVSDASELSGRRAAVTIPAGSLLTPADVTASQPISSGDAVVGLALKAGQLPAAGLEPGDRVIIVQTASPGTPLSSASTTSSNPGGQSGEVGASTGVLVPEATVFNAEAPPSNSSSSASLLVSVEVSSTLAAAVSTAAAAGQVSLVLLPTSASTSASRRTQSGSNERGAMAHKSAGASPPASGTSP